MIQNLIKSPTVNDLQPTYYTLLNNKLYKAYHLL